MSMEEIMANVGAVNIADIVASNKASETSPYYLHSSEYPGLIFVIHPFSENGENYFTWRHNLMNALQSKNKARFCQFPTMDTMRLPRKLQMRLPRSFKDLLPMRKLQEKYGRTWRKDSLMVSHHESMTYYGKLKSFWDEMQSLNLIPLCKCGCRCSVAKKMQTVRKKEKVFDFLMGLDEVYSTVRSQFLRPNLGRAYPSAAQEEKQCSTAATRAPIIDETTLLAKGNTSSQKKNDNVHRNQFAPCVHCGRTNHSKEHYYKMVGYPSKWRKPSRNNDKQITRDQSSECGNQLENNHATYIPIGGAFAGTVNGEGSPILGLTLAQHQQLLVLLRSSEPSTGTPSADMAVSNFSGKICV
ncbi:hypothetical protein CDL12_20161 [Handroanthus impetiginosus]|uniref:Retrotransposon Copia-like N-terminal domain-containing protein n=1 Tax=Handroanthus impetiginosus TaxID=429701 RepID=A0A2G9GPX6_9LAMI|nr:hypothetical protein CDL12_20161 [Handroanthus impetiginosus]